MATTSKFGLIGVNDTVRYGISGGYVDWNGTVFRLLDDDGTSLSNVRVATLPVNANDAASKSYVDGRVQGVSAKATVVAATTGPGTLSTDFENGDILDSVILTTGDRILIKDQATASENGIYEVQASGAPVRAPDADVSADMTAAFTFIENGTTHAGQGWTTTFDDATDALGVDPVNWTQFSTAGSFTASEGVQLVGSDFRLDVSGLISTTTVNGTDSVPFYDVGAGAHRRRTFTNMISDLGLMVGSNNLSEVTNANTARNNLGLNPGGAGDIWVERSGDTMTGDLTMNGGDVRIQDGTVTNPSLRFDNSANTGLYSAGVDEIGVSVNGTQRFLFRDGGTTDTSFVFNSTDAVELPDGTTGQRPSVGVNGMFRYNTTLNAFEGYAGGSWLTFGSGSGDLLAANNLSDLANIATARTNLGLVAGGAGDIWVERAGDTMSGTLNMGGNTLAGPLDPTSGNQVGDRNYNDARYLLESNNLSDLTNVTTALTNLGLVAGGANDIWVERAGDTMSGTLNMGGNTISSPLDPTLGTHVGDRDYNDARYLLESSNLSDLTNTATARTNLGLTSGGAGDIWVDTAGDTMTGSLSMDSGAQILSDGSATASAPALSFDTDTDTGFFLSGVNTIGVSTNGSSRMTIQDGGGINSSVIFSNTDAITLPVGTTGQRPSSPVNGMIRYSSTTGEFEGYSSGAWDSLGSGGDLLSTNNLSDVANVATARTNLGLVSGGTGDIWVERAGDAMSGTLNMNANTLTNPLDPTAGNEVGDRNYNDARYLLEANNLSDVGSAASARTNLGLVSGGTGDIWVERSGDTMSGALDMGFNAISNTLDPTAGNQVGDRDYNDARYLLSANNLSDIANYATARSNMGLVAGGVGDIWVERAGDTMSGSLTMDTGAQVQLDGTAGSGTPAVAFDSDPNTGLFSSGADAIGITTNGALTATFQDGAGVDASFVINTTDALQLPSGSSGQRPSSAVNGMIRYNNVTPGLEAYVDGSWESVGVSTITNPLTVYEYTATAGQTLFTGTDDNAQVLSYTPGTVLVTVNGVVMDSSEYTATNSTDVTLSTAASANDIVQIVAWDFGTTFNVADAVSASTGGTFIGGVAFNNGITITNGGLSVTGVADFDDGTAAAPSITFNADTDTGFFRPAVDQIGITTNGTNRITVQDGGGFNSSVVLEGTDALTLHRGTTVQRDLLTGVDGMVRYNTTDNTFEGFADGAWGPLGGAGATGGGTDEIFWENGQTVTTDYTITPGKNAMSAGPITIAVGVTVTVGPGETWTVV